MSRLCATCEWWAPDDGDRGEPDHVESTGAESGECRYHAPLTVPDEDLPGLPREPYRLHAAWPYTDWNAWCRHWLEVEVDA